MGSLASRRAHPWATTSWPCNICTGGKSYRTGSDTYQFTGAAIDRSSLGGELYINPTLRTKQVIWDSGGYNVLDLSGFEASSSGYRLDLNPLGWLSTNANYLTTYLMAGAVVGPGRFDPAHYQLGQQRHDFRERKFEPVRRLCARPGHRCRCHPRRDDSRHS